MILIGVWLRVLAWKRPVYIMHNGQCICELRRLLLETLRLIVWACSLVLLGLYYFWPRA
jgi:hypothetical protein